MNFENQGIQKDKTTLKWKPLMQKEKGKGESTVGDVAASDEEVGLAFTCEFEKRFGRATRTNVTTRHKLKPMK